MFADLRPAFPTGVHICWGGGGGGQQASSLSSKHKLAVEFPQVQASRL